MVSNTHQDRQHQEFTKYDEQGAYHWKQMRCSLKRFNAGLAGRYEMAEQILRKHLLDFPANRILDIGCGDGYFTNILADVFSGAEVLGFDFSVTGIGYAKEMSRHPGIKFSVGDAFDSPGLFDLIVVTDVIEHVPDAADFLRRCTNKLSDNGYIFCSTPIRIKEIPDDPFHIHEFFYGELESLMEDGGFKCLDHAVSHDYKILASYGKRYSIFGLGKMRLSKYKSNFLACFLKKNPFSKIVCELPTMQYLLAQKK